MHRSSTRSGISGVVAGLLGGGGRLGFLSGLRMVRANGAQFPPSKRVSATEFLGLDTGHDFPALKGVRERLAHTLVTRSTQHRLPALSRLGITRELRSEVDEGSERF